MSLSQGRSYLAIPGPSVMPDRVLQAMHRPAPNIYYGALEEMVHGILPDLRAVARTRHAATIYIGNGHAAWEAAIANVLAPGDRVLVLNTGHFAAGWGQMADGLGINVETLEFGKRGVVDPDQVEDRLRRDTAGAIKAVLVVQVDTASSVRNDVAAIRKAIDAANHPALFMVDCIASLACERFEMDAWDVDITVAACQKGLMTPPGLAFVFFNEKAAEARGKMARVSRYWDWVPRADPEIFPEHFCGTAPTHHLYGLREALNMILHEEGLEAVFARHKALSEMIWAACEVWGQDGGLEMNISDPDRRSHAVTSLRLPAPGGEQLRSWLEENAGVTLGIGLGMAPRTSPEIHGYFRIGHMGHVNAHMVMGVLGTMDAGMKALGLSHGTGALEAAASLAARA